MCLHFVPTYINYYIFLLMHMYIYLFVESDAPSFCVQIHSKKGRFMVFHINSIYDVALSAIYKNEVIDKWGIGVSKYSASNILIL